MGNSEFAAPSRWTQVIAASELRHATAPSSELRLNLLLEGALTHHRIGGIGEEDLAGKLDALRRWTQQSAPRRGSNAALVDTTLLASVHSSALGRREGPRVNGLALLDLAAFANAVVLYDHVVALPGAKVVAREINTVLGEEFIRVLPVPVKTDEHGGLTGIGAVLGCLFESCIFDLSAVHAARRGEWLRGDLDEMARTWSILLGQKVRGKDVVANWSTERDWWDSNGPSLVADLAGFEGHAPGASRTHNAIIELASRGRVLLNDRADSLPRLVSECNHRSYFNLRLSYVLGVPYVGSAARVPFRHALYQDACIAHRQLLLQQELNRTVNPQAYDAPGSAITLPIFAAVAVERAADPEDVLVQLAVLREKGAALRERRAELEAALGGRNHADATRSIRDAIRSDAKKLSWEVAGPPVTGVAAILAAAASPSTKLTLALIGICTAFGVLSDRVPDIARRLFRPSLWFLSSTADYARGIISTREDVARVWSVDDQAMRRLSDRMSKLSQLPPA